LQNARKAVGIDQKGYWWIETRSLWQSGTGDAKKFFDDYSINGPKQVL
jgi:hypothetical protein